MTYEEFKKGMADELGFGRNLTIADLDQAYTLGKQEGVEEFIQYLEKGFTISIPEWGELGQKLGKTVISLLRDTQKELRTKKK